MGIPVLKQTTAYRIERGIPVPPRRNGRAFKYPFAEMAVGDSFRFEGEGVAIRSAASYYGSRNNRKFSVYREGAGWRIWRVS